jgi:hypothetical protein
MFIARERPVCEIFYRIAVLTYCQQRGKEAKGTFLHVGAGCRSPGQAILQAALKGMFGRMGLLPSFRGSMT